MNRPAILSRQGRHLLQLGVGLLLFTSFEGFVIPYFTVPRLGLSAHTLSALLSVLLLTLGLLWPRLNLGVATCRIAFWFLVYSALAIIGAYVMAGVWGAGDSTIRLAARTGHGSVVQETAIKIAAYSSAPTGIISFGLILWGLRIEAGNQEAPPR